MPEKWWRRFVPRREPAKAGTRRRRRTSAGRVVGRFLRWALAVLLLGSAGLYGLHGPFRSAVDDHAVSAFGTVRDWFTADPRPVRPNRVTASAAAPGHGPELVADNATNTHWAAPGDPLPSLEFTFDAPADLTRAIFRVGVGDRFQTAKRPADVRFAYSTGQVFDLRLADTPDEQTVRLANGEGARSVRLEIRSLHGSLEGDDVAISEIEFFEAG